MTTFEVDYAEWDTIKAAFMNGEITKKQARVLMARMGYATEQLNDIMLAWSAQKRRRVPVASR